MARGTAARPAVASRRLYQRRGRRRDGVRRTELRGSGRAGAQPRSRLGPVSRARGGCRRGAEHAYRPFRRQLRLTRLRAPVRDGALAGAWSGGGCGGRVCECGARHRAGSLVQGDLQRCRRHPFGRGFRLDLPPPRPADRRRRDRGPDPARSRCQRRRLPGQRGPRGRRCRDRDTVALLRCVVGEVSLAAAALPDAGSDRLRAGGLLRLAGLYGHGRVHGAAGHAAARRAAIHGAYQGLRGAPPGCLQRGSGQRGALSVAGAERSRCDRRGGPQGRPAVHERAGGGGRRRRCRGAAARYR